MILVAGGSRDPHLDHILGELRRRGLDHRALRVGPDSHPRLHVDMDGTLHLDGEVLRPDALLLRHDVFAGLEDDRRSVRRRALAWYDALAAWALLCPEVRVPNRHFLGRTTNKVEVLMRARRLGLRIPDTVLSNDLTALMRFEGGTHVAKPISGGSLALPLGRAVVESTAVDGALAAPAIVQERLVGPELRVYRVGQRLLSFEIRSCRLDYRADPSSRVIPHVGPPPGVARGLMALSDELGLELCAADLKTCPHSGELVFLELNSQPMFDAHDVVSGGSVSRAIADLLADRPLVEARLAH